MTEFITDKKEIEPMRNALNLILDALRLNNIPENIAGQALLNITARMIALSINEENDEDVLADLRNGIKILRKELKKKPPMS